MLGPSPKSRRRQTLGVFASAYFAFELLFVALPLTAQAQLVVTEMMVNPTSNNDAVWEWIEVKNSGATPLNLNGYIAGKLGETKNINANITPTKAANTIIPAGGVGVLYDGAGSDYNDQLFRQAWNLAPSVPLVAVEGWPSLSNSGTSRDFGFWPDAAAYTSALADDGMGTLKVSSFTGAAFSVDYSTGFPPTSANGPSLAWNGSGNYQDGANWSASITGANGAYTSVPVTVSGTPINNTNDRGNPGRVPPGSAAPGLLITEVMYDPASTPESNWEWVEIYNSTGAMIDFGATPYLFHDTTSSSDLTEPNVTSGVLAANKTAVLFNSANTMQNMIDAWDPGGALGTLFIPVDNFPSLNNSGDTIALWDSLAKYQIDAAGSTPPRTANQATTVLTYDDATPWQPNNNAASIFLANLVSPPANGANWLRSAVDDFVDSKNAIAVTQDVAIHPGGDIGSPGTFNGSGTPTPPAADFNHNGTVDAPDLVVWKASFHLTAGGDADGDGDTDGADFLLWQRSLGATSSQAASAPVPEPAAVSLLLAAILTFTSFPGPNRHHP
jgi:hypothetical protein